MFLLYAPLEKFGPLPPRTPLMTDEVLFTHNVAYCSKYYWKKYHIIQGCRDITPHILRRLRDRRTLRQILVLAHGGFGDSMWCMPFAKALRDKHPQSRILILTEEKNMPLWHGIPYANACVKDEYWNKQSLIRQADEVYDFGGVATFLKKEMKLDPIEAIFKMGELPLPKKNEDCRPLLVMTIDEGRIAEQLLRRHNINTSTDKIITLALESSTPNRNWPHTYARTLSENLTSLGFKVVWLTNTKDYADTYFIGCACGWETPVMAQDAPKSIDFTCPVCGLKTENQKLEHIEGVANLSGKTDIRQAAAIIALSDAFIGPNSGLMVIATALNIPTVGLFGAFDPKLRAKFYDKFTGLMGTPPCAPCNEHWTECHKGYPAPCMKLLTPSRVEGAVLDLIKKYPKTALERRPIT